MENNNISDERLASLMEEHMGLVVLLVSSFRPKTKEKRDELIQLGRIGLWKALKKHDPERSKLSTTIWNYVKWEILRNMDREKRVSPLKTKDNLYDIEDKKSDIVAWEYIPDYLDNRESQIIKLKIEGYSIIEISKKIGISRGWTSHLYKSAINKIKSANEQKKADINVQ